jgi:hypothetical protein
MPLINPDEEITEAGDYTITANLATPRLGITATSIRAYQDNELIEDSGNNPANFIAAIPDNAEGEMVIRVEAEDSLGREYSLQKTYSFNTLYEMFIFLGDGVDPRIQLFHPSAPTTAIEPDSNAPPEYVRDMDYTIDGLIACTDRNTLRAYKISEGEIGYDLKFCQELLSVSAYVYASSFNHTGEVLITKSSYSSGQTYIYKRYDLAGVDATEPTERFQQTSRIAVGAGEIEAFSPNEDIFATQSFGVIYISRLVDGYFAPDAPEYSLSIAGTSGWGNLRWSYDGRFLAGHQGTTSWNVKILEWLGGTLTEVAISGVVQQVPSSSGSLNQLAWHPSRHLLLCGAEDTNLLMLVRVVPGSPSTATNITATNIDVLPINRTQWIGWSADGQYAFASSSAGYRRYLFDAEAETLTYIDTVGSLATYAITGVYFKKSEAKHLPIKYLGWSWSGKWEYMLLSQKQFLATRNPLVGSSNMYCRHSRTKSSGKYDVRFIATLTGGATAPVLGVCKTYYPDATGVQNFGYTDDQYAVWTWDSTAAQARTMHNNTFTNHGDFGNMSTGQEVMMAVDFTAGKIWFGIDGTWFNSGDPEAGTNPTYSSMPAGDYYLAVSLIPYGGVCSARIVHPDDFVTPVTPGFEPGWPEYDGEWNQSTALPID